MFVSTQAALRGMARVDVNVDAIAADLDANWEVRVLSLGASFCSVPRTSLTGTSDFGSSRSSPSQFKR